MSAQRSLFSFGFGGCVKVCAVGAVAGVALLGAAPVFALPPGGAGGDTPGTSSSVSPSTVKQCETLSFSVHGFPAGETVNVKIDDGLASDGDTSIQGQGVVATARIDSGGTASGSVEIPCDLSPGQHHLRYLANREILKDGKVVGFEGYTNRGGSVFTVVAADSGSGSGDSNTQDTTNTNTMTTGGNDTNESSRSGGNTQRSVRAGRQAVSDSSAQDEDEDFDNDPASAAVAGTSGSTGGSTGGSSGGSSSGHKLDDKAAKAGGFAQASGAKAPEHNGIFNKNVKQTADTQAQAAPASQAPYIGLFVGGAILLVGMTAINAWMLIARRNGTN